MNAYPSKTEGISAAIVGATGLVGSELVTQLLANDRFNVAHILARRLLEATDPVRDSKLVQHQIDFKRLAQSDWPASDILFCCLGTTIKKAGSQAAFREVDFDYVVESARRARSAGARRLVVVSAMGANPDSRIFYNRVKGEMEGSVAALGYESVVILRPALISGERRERRPIERVWQAAFKIGNRILPPKYRSVPAKSIAAAMVTLAAAARSGLTIVESDQIQAVAALNQP
jgi:uncharacterized protein YbjT (DUF2867 family)